MHTDPSVILPLVIVVAFFAGLLIAAWVFGPSK